MKSAKQINKEIFGFIKKCQQVEGMSFDEAIELWFDLAPLRGGEILERGSSFDDDHEQEPSALPLSEPSALLTVDEVCDYLGISRSTLYRQDIPGRCKVGGQVRYVKADVDRWLNANSR
ncbi:helix-turn-helix domain-containing protein [Geobacter sulfurreducens]|uniref:helix-turn-helix domain-containing protein n=1 Tax=Geobacter sulfurreducens TaxID=35554 RepID=UPI0020B7EEBF|nr:helix-turn-helix domain-containing protein [Geobacter sulfurreducens]UTG91191.1 helix-turn-helix domain-containing protein [Geobacter sulfurreducens]HML78253.1 helix-turn-helix domain-containing protein [Geobacter sulfurreducens]